MVSSHECLNLRRSWWTKSQLSVEGASVRTSWWPGASTAQFGQWSLFLKSLRMQRSGILTKTNGEALQHVLLKKEMKKASKLRFGCGTELHYFVALLIK